MDKVYELIGLIVVGFVVVLLMTLPVMWLWNWLMPHLFGLVTIDFWEALGLSTLCSILLKSTNNNSSKK